MSTATYLRIPVTDPASLLAFAIADVSMGMLVICRGCSSTVLLRRWSEGLYYWGFGYGTYWVRLMPCFSRGCVPQSNLDVPTM